MASSLLKTVCVISLAVACNSDRAFAREPTRAQWDRSTPAASVAGVIAANRAGDPEAIIAGFVPAERARIRQMVSNPAMLAANTAIARKIVSSQLRRVRNYRGYAVVTMAETFRDGRTQLKNYPFKRTRVGWLLTNDLAADPGFKPFD